MPVPTPTPTPTPKVDPNALVVTLKASDLDALLDDRFEQLLAQFTEGTQPKLLRRSELAERLKVTERTVFSLVQVGLPYYLVGSSQRYDWQECLAWLRDQGKVATDV